MTIHSEHPFLEPEGSRDPVRRMRGRLGGAVALLTAGDPDEPGGRAGLTVSSLLLAHGNPAHLLALVDPDSDLADAVRRTGRGVVQLLSWKHRDLAEAFAGTAPAPGGPFKMAQWEPTSWGPVLAGATAWAGFVLAGEPGEVGWSLLLDGTLEHVEVAEEGQPLVHRRGRYVRPA